MNQGNLREGWAYTRVSRNRHYFRGDRSLCNRVRVLDHRHLNWSAARNTSCDCWPCRLRLAKEKRAK